MRSSYKLAGNSEARPDYARPTSDLGALTIDLLANGVHVVRFRALGCPCEVLVEGTDERSVMALGEAAAHEAWRIERKFSRYRDDSVLAAVHRARGKPTRVDSETAGLLDFAHCCYKLSDGLFDITSGILRRAWTFDGSDRIPEHAKIAEILPLIGLSKLRWQSPELQLPVGMELDFGGIGKEYAVDRAFAIVGALTSVPYLVNFGGDLRASAAPARGPWKVGVERPGREGAAIMLLDLTVGALATSGDTHRFLIKDGIRYGHVLDPRTGWPVIGSPHSVTVAAATCTEAGMWATIALLKGTEAASFLESQGRIHWIIPSETTQARPASS